MFKRLKLKIKVKFKNKLNLSFVILFSRRFHFSLKNIRQNNYLLNKILNLKSKNLDIYRHINKILCKDSIADFC